MIIPQCRLYVLVATHAPVALILRRGPSTWWHLIKWDLERLTLEPGAWLKGTLYPRRSDISPDGQLFGYFALRSSPPPWDTYFAVSKVPWLTALAAWHTHGTWTGGCQFYRDGRLAIAGAMDIQPFYGHYPKAAVGGMDTDWVHHNLQNEYKRGWQAMPDDPHDLRQMYLPDTATPAFLMRRYQPGRQSGVLILAHAGVDFSRPGIEGVQVHYLREERDSGKITPLPETAWADWDQQGRLLMATRDGTVSISEVSGDAWVQTWSANLRDLVPAPTQASAWAQKW
jgi:hypothetical protein